MKKLILLAIAVTASAQTPATSAVPVTKTTIAGIPVIHKRVTANDVIAVQVYLKGGSAALTPAMAGVGKCANSKGTTPKPRVVKLPHQSAASQIGQIEGRVIGAVAGRICGAKIKCLKCPRGLRYS